MDTENIVRIILHTDGSTHIALRNLQTYGDIENKK